MPHNRATFRFYEELNDFLPAGRRKTAFAYSFDGNPTVKDAIEAMGVPHVEVDMILVDSQPVGFAYKLKDNDYVSVYPMFETLNISGVSPLRGKPLRDTKFILDVHLGKLVKYLRLLGFDTLYRNDYDDWEIIRISLAEHRIILTRDIGLLKVKTVTHGYWVRNQQPKAQVKEVLQHFDLYSAIDPFNRCIKCNGSLEVVEKDTILDQLGALTKKYFDEFKIKYPNDDLVNDIDHWMNIPNEISNNGSYIAVAQAASGTQAAENAGVSVENYPNPFNPTTKISFSVPQKSQIRLKVFDVLGREVANLADGVYEAGKYEVSFDASKLPSGVYFYNLTTGTNSITKKMLLMK